MITVAQIRAARTMLGWRQRDLAERADLSLMTVKNIEREEANPRASTLQAIQTALEAGGVEFTPRGVGLR